MDGQMNSLPHPIHRIPPELLSDILIQGTPLRYTSISERRSILAPSHVCRHWRTVALSTSHMWTFILFQCGQDISIPRELDCARAWLSRSGQHSLEISTHQCLSEWASKSAIELLIPHCMRWREIDTRDMHSDVFLQIKGNIPLLESADIGNIKSPTDINLFAVAPRLRRLKFQNLSASQLDLVSFPWIQLNHLDITTSIAAAFHHILVSAPNLTFLRVAASRSYPLSSGAEFATITNSNITTFHLFSARPSTNTPILYLLDRLVLPALTNLTLSSPGESGRNLISFISRSACSLSFLRINMFAQSKFIELMQLLPTLQELFVILRHAREWAPMVECFTFQRDLHLAPNLRSLDMYWGFPSRGKEVLSLDILADMVESRWSSQSAGIDMALMRSPLNHVKVHQCRTERIVESSSALVRLRKLWEDGLDVTVFTAEIPPRDFLWDQHRYQY